MSEVNGWLEGFKAIAQLIAVASGVALGWYVKERVVRHDRVLEARANWAAAVGNFLEARARPLPSDHRQYRNDALWHQAREEEQVRLNSTIIAASERLQQAALTVRLLDPGTAEAVRRLTEDAARTEVAHVTSVWEDVKAIVDEWARPARPGLLKKIFSEKSFRAGQQEQRTRDDEGGGAG